MWGCHTSGNFLGEDWTSRLTLHTVGREKSGQASAWGGVHDGEAQVLRFPEVLGPGV